MAYVYIPAFGHNEDEAEKHIVISCLSRVIGAATQTSGRQVGPKVLPSSPVSRIVHAVIQLQ
jgi:hypothetical protein